MVKLKSSVQIYDNSSYLVLTYNESIHRHLLTEIYCFYLLLCGPPPYEGPHIASHAICLSVYLSVCLSVRLSVRPVIVAIGNVFSSTASVMDALFGTHWGPHIVRPSRPHRFLFQLHIIFAIRLSGRKVAIKLIDWLISIYKRNPN